jgi:osmotically-inducible protein OsmY
MTRLARLGLLLPLALCCSMSGCATFATFAKCGFAGCPGDKKITAEVQTLFDQHPALEAPNDLHIQTLNAVVYLTGIVNSPREQTLATLVARQAPGVTDVVNSIGLYPGR